MKKEKARLADLASKMKGTGQGSEDIRKADTGKTDFRNTATIDANPPHGEKGDFRKITITLPPEAYELLVNEAARRKIAGEPNHLMSAMMREAIVLYLKPAK